jgi:hypothetical protein
VIVIVTSGARNFTAKFGLLVMEIEISLKSYKKAVIDSKS